MSAYSAVEAPAAGFTGQYAPLTRAPQWWRDILEAEDPLQQLVASSRDELARLAATLETQGCTTVVLGINGATSPIRAPGAAANCTEARSLYAQSATIYDSESLPIALLGCSCPAPPSGASQTLLQALLDSCARSITERWFRLCHRRHWIIAARKADDPRASLLLAFDTDSMVVGADRGARQHLMAVGRGWASALSLKEFFDLGLPDIRLAPLRDFTTDLRATARDEIWHVLITPPAVATNALRGFEHTLFHTRPRMETLLLLARPHSSCERTPRLPPRIKQQIERFVAANLQSPLTTSAIATHFGYSSSYFHRMFSGSFGITPRSYILHRRVEFVQDLLIRTDKSLAEIALHAGFADQPHLSRCFRSALGTTPGAFRRKNRDPALHSTRKDRGRR